MNSNKHTIVELFSGPGGLSLGFHIADFNTLVAYEYEDDSINTYKENFPNTNVVKKDLANLTDEDINELKNVTGLNVDIVMGGPPCRSFSTSNPKRSHGDKRDFYYKQLIRVANELNAKYFFMENVDDILSKSISKNNPKKIFHCLLEDLQEAGFFYINFKILNSADYGTPQTRSRIFIIATKDENLPLTFPKPTHSNSDNELYKWVSVDQAFEDLPQVTSSKDTIMGLDQSLSISKKINKSKFNVCEEYKKSPDNNFTKYCRGIPNDEYPFAPFQWKKYDENKLSLYIIPEHSHRIIHRYSLLEEDENQGDLVSRLKLQLSEDEFKILLDKKIIPAGVFVQKNRKLPASIPSRTVTSHAREELVHPHLNRNLTAREVARLQGFPDWYTFCGANQKPHKPFSEIEDEGTGRDFYQQIGDAVPPLLAAALAREIKKNLLAVKNATWGEFRKNLIKYIYLNNIKPIEVKQVFRIDPTELAEQLSGIKPPNDVVLNKIGSKLSKEIAFR